MYDVHLIGIEDGKAVGSNATRRQIERVKALECALQHDGEPLPWSLFDDPDEERSLFRFVEADRRKRIDEETLMADRPPFAVVTEIDGEAHRFQFFEGHDALSLSHDVRSQRLAGKDLDPYLERDPHAYDPVAFLKANFPQLVNDAGGKEAVRQMLDAAHTSDS